MNLFKSLTALTSMAIACAVVLVAPGFAQNNPKLSDAEVASVAVTANQIDIDYAGIAIKKSKNQEILGFANTMATDHKAVIDQAVTLVKKLNVTPKDNPVSQKLLADAEKTKKALTAASGKAFDKLYVDNEVTYHKAVISAVEGLLIPETENAELKELLQNILPALNTHLEHAQMIQKKHTSQYK
jgi:putative membrane protein